MATVLAPTRSEAPERPVPLHTACVLSRDEVAQCIHIGTERNDKNVQNHSRNLNFSGRDDATISIQGVMGEWAFCRLFGLDTALLFNTQCRNRWNDSFDATIGGRTIDVKTPLHHTSVLWVGAARGEHAPDLYCLMTLERLDYLDDPHTASLAPFCDAEQVEVVFRGFIHRGMLLVGGNARRRGRNTVFIATQAQLRPLEEVLQVTDDATPSLF